MENTNWSVITGAPCSGKTSVINRLANMGFQIAPEVARALINQLIIHHPNGDVANDILLLQQAILEEKLAREEILPKEALVFFDRGLPDSIAYYQYKGIDPQPVLSLCYEFRYKHIFIFDRLPLQTDEVRREDEATVAQLDSLIRAAYVSVGYHPIVVPVMSIEARTEFVLDHSARAR